MTREAARFKQGVRSRRRVGGAGLALRDQATDHRKTGRMAKGWGQGGGWVSQGWLGAYIMLKKQRVRRDSSQIWGDPQDSTQNYCAERTHCQMLPLNSTPIYLLQ